MRRVLALDPSSKTGWALFVSTSLSEGKPLQAMELKEYGILHLGAPILTFEGAYPKNVMRAAWAMVDKLIELIRRLEPTEIVIEDTNPGRQALAQRFLEWLHYSLLSSIDNELVYNKIPRVSYIRTGVWRHKLGLSQTKADAKNNRVAKKIAGLAETNPELAKRMRKETGVRGRVTKKHYAVRMANGLFNKSFKVKDNDIADAILLGLAYIQGADINDGT
jgi:hypothetical protein